MDLAFVKATTNQTDSYSTWWYKKNQKGQTSDLLVLGRWPMVNKKWYFSCASCSCLVSLSQNARQPDADCSECLLCACKKAGPAGAKKTGCYAHSKPRFSAPFLQTATVSCVIKRTVLISTHLSTKVALLKSQAVNAVCKIYQNLFGSKALDSTELMQASIQHSVDVRLDST